jgi:hypothetical protein
VETEKTVNNKKEEDSPNKDEKDSDQVTEDKEEGFFACVAVSIGNFFKSIGSFFKNFF